MAIQRRVRKTEIGPNRVRYRVLVTGEPCPPNTNEARHHQHYFLRWLVDNQSMLECGYSVFERLVVSHNGTCWQAEAEAEVDEASA